MGIYRTAIEEARDLRVGSPRASRLWLSQWETSLRQERVCRSRYHQTPSPTYTLLVSTRLNPNKILTAKVIVRNEHKYTWTPLITHLNIKRI